MVCGSQVYGEDDHWQVTFYFAVHTMHLAIRSGHLPFGERTRFYAC